MLLTLFRCLAGVWIVWLALSSAYAQTGPASPGSVPATEQATPLSSREACLLQALRQARLSTTVAELQLQCQLNVSSNAPTTTSASPGSTTATPLAAAPRPEDSAAAPAPITASANATSATLVVRPLSVMQQRMVSEMRAHEEPFALLPHRPNYVLPVSYFKRSNPGLSATGQLDRATEAMFQMSFKFPLSKPLLGDKLIPFFAYTGRAWWQVYDGERSRPFREYNHEPEFFVGAPVSGFEAMGWSVRAMTAGFNHQSNGRSVPESRSWNRLFVEAYADHGSSTWSTLKAWYRIPEKAKLTPQSSKGDDNPDITRYMGHFEFKLGHVRPQSHNLTLTARKSFASGGKGALQLDWSHPVRYAPGLRWYASVFDGYGESLIDYNQRVRRVGLGIMVNDWF